jgi:Tfp pilus assembly major pilin PilA
MSERTERTAAAQAILGIPLFNTLMDELEAVEVNSAVAAPYDNHEARQGHLAAVRAIRNLRSRIKGIAAASAVATLAAVAGKTTYISGFTITGAGATAASVVVATLTGVVTGTMSYVIAVPAGAAVGITPLIIKYTSPIPASAPNTAIVVTLPSLGAGNTNAAVTAHGFQI